MAVVFNITFNARDPRGLVRFWSEVTGYPVAEQTDDLVRLRGPRLVGAPDLLVVRADVPSISSSRVHLDLATLDVGDEAARLVALGATLVDGGSADTPTMREANGIRWLVMCDPEGNEFCLGTSPDRG